jgi:hypothetical protein
MQAAGWLLLAIGASGVVPERLALPIAYIAGDRRRGLGSGRRCGSAPAAGAGATPPPRRWGWRWPFPAVLLDRRDRPARAGGVADPRRLLLVAAAALARGWAEASMLRRFLALATALLALVVGARGALVLLAPAAGAG